MYLKHLVAGAACALAMSSAAEAATHLITQYQGTVWYGTDNTGVFDLAGTDFETEQHAFHAQVVMDLGGGVRTTVPGVSDLLQSDGANSPFVSAWISVNGVRYDLHAETFAGISIQSHNSSMVVATQDPETTGIIFNDVLDLRFDDSPDFPTNLETPFTTHTGVQGGPNVFAVYRYDTDTDTILEQAFIRVNIDSMQQTTAAVPEPATWALMILGFGSAGAALRRQRAVREVAPCA